MLILQIVSFVSQELRSGPARVDFAGICGISLRMFKLCDFSILRRNLIFPSQLESITSASLLTVVIRAFHYVCVDASQLLANYF